MIRIRTLVMSLAALVVAGALIGQAASMRAQPTAVATVNVQEVFNNLKEKTSLEAQMQSRTEQLQQQEQQRRQSIEQLRQDLDVLAPGSDAYQQKEQELQQKVIDLQVWTQFKQQQMRVERGLQVEGLYRRTLNTVQRIAQDNGYDLVLFEEQEPDFNYENPQQLLTVIQMRKVLYASDQISITDQVIQRMNNEYEAGSQRSDRCRDTA